MRMAAVAGAGVADAVAGGVVRAESGATWYREVQRCLQMPRAIRWMGLRALPLRQPNSLRRPSDHRSEARKEPKGHRLGETRAARTVREKAMGAKAIVEDAMARDATTAPSARPVDLRPRGTSTASIAGKPRMPQGR